MNLQTISKETLEALDISTADVVAAIEHLLHGQKQGRVWTAPKAVILPPDDRFLMATLACADDPPFMAVKALFLSPHNAERGMEAIQSVVTLMDSQTGRPCAVIDGNWITAIRTACLSTVAAKRLARPESSSVAFIGCGVQARSHLQAFADLFPLREIRAFGRGQANRDRLCRMAEGMGLRAMDCTTAEEAIKDADLVVTSISMTPKPEPFIDARWLKPGAFAAIADQAIPWMPAGVSSFDRIIIDDLIQERQMVSPMVDLSLVHGDLAGLVQGDAVGRTSESERTALVFRGLGIGDLAVAALAYMRFQA